MATGPLGYLAMGATLGLGAGLTPGPLLTLVLKQTLTHGPREGAKVALSPLITDIPILIGMFFALSWMAEHAGVMGIISLAGAAVVSLFALECFKTREIVVPGGRARPGSLKKGVLANFSNPHVYIFWATVGAPATVRAAETGLLSPALFLGGFYVCIVGAKMSVAWLAGRFKGLLSGWGYRAAMILLGLALAAFAILLVRDGLRFLDVWN